MAIRVPLGFRFRPTEAELISYFLERKERGLPVACDHIIEKEVYGDNATPWKVFSEDEPWTDFDHFNKKKMIFVVSKLSKVGNSNKKMCRVAGCGTWDGKSVSQNVKDFQGRIIGKKRAFTFKPKKGFESEMKGKGHWIMHEMSVDGYSHVICRITRDFSKQFHDHGKKQEEEEISTATGTRLSYDDHQQESCRKRKLTDQSDGGEKEEDGFHGKKLCNNGGNIGTLPVQQTDVIDVSFLFDDQEEACTYSSGAAERFTSYIQDFGSCMY